MSKWEYALNSVAWLIVGYTIRLVVERTRGWWAKRQGNELPPVGATTFIGTLFILLTIVQFLLTYSARLHADSARLHADSIQRCQDNINKNNVAVANIRNELQTTLNAKVNAVIKAKAAYDGQFLDLILHPVDQTDKAAVKKVTTRLSKALDAVLVSEGDETAAFLAARTYVRQHPSVPVTVCTGDTEPLVSPSSPGPSPTPSR